MLAGVLAGLVHAGSGAGNLQQHSAALYTSGTLSAQQLAALESDGLTIVIDLRQAVEGTADSRAIADELGLGYANLPVGRELPNQRTMDQISAIIDAAVTGKVLLHCASGHRAGMVLALYLQQHGTSSAAALASAQVAGTRADGLVQLQTRFEQLPAADDTATSIDNHNHQEH